MRTRSVCTKDSSFFFTVACLLLWLIEYCVREFHLHKAIFAMALEPDCALGLLFYTAIVIFIQTSVRNF
jgi:hypothetical protein